MYWLSNIKDNLRSNLRAEISSANLLLVIRHQKVFIEDVCLSVQQALAVLFSDGKPTLTYSCIFILFLRFHSLVEIISGDLNWPWEIAGLALQGRSKGMTALRPLMIKGSVFHLKNISNLHSFFYETTGLATHFLVLYTVGPLWDIHMSKFWVARLWKWLTSKRDLTVKPLTNMFLTF